MQFRKILSLSLFVAFLNLFFFREIGGLGWSLLVLGSWVFLFMARPTTTQTGKRRAVLSVLPVLFLSLGFFLRANHTAQTFLIWASVWVFSLLLYLSAAKLPLPRSLMELTLFGKQLFRGYLGSLLKMPISKPAFRVTSKTASFLFRIPWRSLIVGGIVGVPIVLILVTLLASGDPVFRTTLRNLPKLSLDFIDFSSTLIKHLIVSFVALVALAPVLIMKAKHQFKNPVTSWYNKSLANELIIVLALVAFTLGAFLIIQWPYVFVNVAAETDLSQFGVNTYSEYVQRGFKELMMAAALVYGLVWSGLVALRGHSRSGKKVLKKLQLFTLAELGVFLLSIFRRVWLYQHHHGWSLVRVYGSAFLLVLAGFTLTLLARHLWLKRWVKVELAIIGLVIILLGLGNVEAFIAKEGNQPTVNNRIDYVYLSRLSADGYNGWEQSYDHINNVLMDESLDSKPIIEKEDRRQIAYAGIALEQLLSHHHDLIQVYGTPEEQEFYLTKIKQYSLTMISQLRQSLQARSQHNSNVYENPDGIEYFVNSLKTEERTSLGHIDFLAPANFKGVNKIFSDGRCRQDKSCALYRYSVPNSFFIINEYGWESQKLTKYSANLQYNQSEQDAYLTMQEDMPFMSLLALQRRFFALYERIANQPENEQSIEADISLDTPFLQRL